MPVGIAEDLMNETQDVLFGFQGEVGWQGLEEKLEVVIADFPNILVLEKFGSIATVPLYISPAGRSISALVLLIALLITETASSCPIILS